MIVSLQSFSAVNQNILMNVAFYLIGNAKFNLWAREKPSDERITRHE